MNGFSTKEFAGWINVQFERSANWAGGRIYVNPGPQSSRAALPPASPSSASHHLAVRLPPSPAPAARSPNSAAPRAPISPAPSPPPPNRAPPPAVIPAAVSTSPAHSRSSAEKFSDRQSNHPAPPPAK